MIISKSKSGQSLLEAVVALGVVTLVLLGLVRAGIVGVRNSSSSQMQALTARYGTEAIEWLRSEEAAIGWTAFNSFFTHKGDFYCLATSPLSVVSTQERFSLALGLPNASCGQIGQTGITRKVTVVTTGVGQVELSVTESWVEGNTQRSASYNAQFSNAGNP